MNQVSRIGFGGDATVLAGYIVTTNASLGNVDLVIENTGSNTLYLLIKELQTGASPSGYASTISESPIGTTAIGTPISVVPSGVITKSYCLLSKRLGFFGSGNTVANISTVIRNPADLRGARLELVTPGKQGWGFENAVNKATIGKNWGDAPDQPAAGVTTNSDLYGGVKGQGHT